MGAVRIENVFKSYEKHDVHKDLSLSIEEGECFVILGPSGCGKTVLLRLISGFEMPDKGKIFMNDKLVVDGTTKESVNTDLRGIGMVFQDYAVWPHMTVFKNIAYPLKIKGVKADVIHEKVMAVVDAVGLTGMDQRLPSQLSGGQQQRVALGRALISEPSIMLLDEPLSNLDANLREEMRFELKALQKRLGMTIIYVTHDQEIALAIADRVAIMGTDGKIMQIGTPIEVFETPVNDYVFNFLGVSNFLPVTKQGNEFFADGQKINAIPANTPPESSNLVAAFRPSDVYFTRSGEGIKGKIMRASFLGAITDFLISIGENTIRTQMDTYEAITQDLMLEEGDECVVNFHTLNLYEKSQVKEGETV